MRVVGIRIGTRTGEQGFTLIEAVVAIGLMATALVALVGVLVLTVNANRRAKETSLAVVFAEAKLESLRHGLLGAPYSSAESLWRNQTGFCEALDEHGVVVGECDASLAQAVFVRRWSIAVSPVAGTVAVRVAVAWQLTAVASTESEQHDEVRLSTLMLVPGA
ncbi:MAG: type II secretion system GspH family protein [Acidobacteriaceae bacterium]|jgi:type II secretory pathway pseudopilin PulG|nr:type II secretion system GspH family protein [Acidobacteriaceae bacterium]